MSAILFFFSASLCGPPQSFARVKSLNCNAFVPLADAKEIVNKKSILQRKYLSKDFATAIPASKITRTFAGHFS